MKKILEKDYGSGMDSMNSENVKYAFETAKKIDAAKEKVNKLKEQICTMLKEHKGELLLEKLPCMYTKHYKRQLCLADYGFKKGNLQLLVHSMSDVLEISTNASNETILKLLPDNPKIQKFSRSTFIHNSTKLLQAHGIVPCSKFMDEYRREFGDQHRLENYGFNNLESVFFDKPRTFFLTNNSEGKCVRLWHPFAEKAAEEDRRSNIRDNWKKRKQIMSDSPERRIRTKFEKEKSKSPRSGKEDLLNSKNTLNKSSSPDKILSDDECLKDSSDNSINDKGIIEEVVGEPDDEEKDEKEKHLNTIGIAEDDKDAS